VPQRRLFGDPRIPRWRDYDGCHRFIRDNPSRWSMNDNDHFHRCMHVYGTSDNNEEHDERIADLDGCIPDHRR
jgi:hypothetical protein